MKENKEIPLVTDTTWNDKESGSRLQQKKRFLGGNLSLVCIFLPFYFYFIVSFLFLLLRISHPFIPCFKSSVGSRGCCGEKFYKFLKKKDLVLHCTHNVVIYCHNLGFRKVPVSFSKLTTWHIHVHNVRKEGGGAIYFNTLKNQLTITFKRTHDVLSTLGLSVPILWFLVAPTCFFSFSWLFHSKGMNFPFYALNFSKIVCFEP